MGGWGRVRGYKKEGGGEAREGGGGGVVAVEEREFFLEAGVGGVEYMLMLRQESG